MKQKLKYLNALMMSALLSLLVLTAPLAALASKEDPRQDVQLQNIMKELIYENDLDIEPQVIEASGVLDSDQINAYTDGKKVIMTDALWEALSTRDARAFVIGHELGHITQGHVTKGAFRNVGVNILGHFIGLFTGNELGYQATRIGASLLNRKFDRNQEYEADDAGMRYIIGAGYDRNASLNVFKTLKEASAGGNRVEFLQTHPLPDSRIDRVIQKYNLNPQKMAAIQHLRYAMCDDWLALASIKSFKQDT